jgi:transcriptional regulator NrdR family protein
MAIQSKHRCQNCKEKSTQVVSTYINLGSDPTRDHFNRRRKCKLCGHRFTTVEISYQTWRTFQRVLNLLRKGERDAKEKSRRKNAEFEL